MITKREKNKIKKILGENYSYRVQEALHNMSVRNRNGMPHSKNMIRNVMNGRPHFEIETAIYKAVETENKNFEKEIKRRALILEQKKTGAATPV